MIERLKSWAESARSIIAFIVAPVALIGGFIMYLLNKNKRLEAEVEQAQAQEKLGAIQGEQKQIDDHAADGLIKYEDLRDEYRKQQGDV